MSSKTVKQTHVEDHIYKIFPNDMNSNQSVFGGLIMGLIDRVAVVVAERHSGKVCATASIDALHFLSPVRLGETLVIKASVNRVWTASMEIGVRVEAETPGEEKRRHVVSAYLTFVALNTKGKPTRVPELVAESRIEKRRYKEAGLRREKRLLMAEEIRKDRENEVD